MKKSILFLLFLAFLASILRADEPLIQIVQKRNWSDLASLFSDKSYENLSSHFSEYQKISLQQYSQREIIYKVKYAEYAEIGFITFRKDKNQYSNLVIENQIKPIHFVQGFRKYKVKDCAFRLGDAGIILREGVLYQALPVRQTGFFFFEGHWDFSITPADPEEKLTLQRYFKSESFSRKNETGAFILQNHDFLQNATFEKEIKGFESPVLLSILGFFQGYFGIQVPEFQEVWYLSVQESENVIAFEKDKKSFYFYDYNEYGIPDTQLRSTGDNRIYLNYNSVRIPKLFVTRSDDLKKVNLNIYYNPDKKILSGTATLFFKNKITFRTLSLNPGLAIHQGITAEYKSVNIFKKDSIYFTSFPETDSLTFYYNGNISGDDQYVDLAQVVLHNHIQKTIDDFFFLSRNQDFYPTSGAGFFRCNLKVNLPEKYSCLGPGAEASAKTYLGRNQYHFVCDGTKGVALVCGDFKRKFTIESKIPVHVFYEKNLWIKKYFSNDDIKECVDFVSNLYGDLHVPAINLLIRRWKDDGGISNAGFIIINMLEPFKGAGVIERSSRTYYRESPVVLSFQKSDFLIHELAHQWWGGQVSWSNYRDEWITEGLAHFSSFLYLQDTLSNKKFEDVMEKSLRWVLKNRDAGPIIYGKRIANLDPYDAFQSIVYNKAALVMLMLREIMGHDQLMERLRLVLTTYKHRNITTRDFIKVVADGNPRLLKFFEQWIYRRTIPEVTYSIQVVKDEVVITINQNGNDFVFPVWMEISTEKGNSLHMEIIEQSIQRVTLRAESPVRSIRVISRYTPIFLKKKDGES